MARRTSSVAVNLSPVQFRSPNLVSTVLPTLARTGLASHRLELEITESVLLADTDVNLVDRCSRLRAPRRAHLAR